MLSTHPTVSLHVATGEEVSGVVEVCGAVGDADGGGTTGAEENVGALGVDGTTGAAEVVEGIDVVGARDGMSVTFNDGAEVGVSDTLNDGAEVGASEALNDGARDGASDKLEDGVKDGWRVGFDEATVVGTIDGLCVVGLFVGVSDGSGEMTMLGFRLGGEFVGSANNGSDCMGLNDGIACSLLPTVAPELLTLFA